MPSANCCVMQVSSPDNLAPRIVRRVSTSRPLFVSSKYGNTSSSCLSSPATVSRHSRHEDIAELQAIFKGGEGLASHGRGPKSMKSSGSLASVKDMLRKHLSRELKVQKRYSRSSVGTSEEEVERRAELRRIRQKRIQEELSHDFSYDSDAESLSAIPGMDSAGEVSGSFGPSERNPPSPALQSPSRLTSSQSSPSLTSPYMKARALQLEARFSELSPTHDSTLLQSPNSRVDIQSNSSDIANTPGTLHLRCHSSPQAVRLSPTEEQLNEAASSSPAPTAPVLKPKRLSNNLSKSSWRLSFNSESRGACLRSLSQDTIPTNAGSAPRPIISHWLKNLGLRSTSQALTWSDGSLDPAFSPPHSRVSSTNYADVATSWLDDTPLRGGSTTRCSITNSQSACLNQEQRKPEYEASYHNIFNAGVMDDGLGDMDELHVRKARDVHTRHCCPASATLHGINVPNCKPSEVADFPGLLFSPTYAVNKIEAGPPAESYDGATETRESGGCPSPPAPVATNLYTETEPANKFAGCVPPLREAEAVESQRSAKHPDPGSGHMGSSRRKKFEDRRENTPGSYSLELSNTFKYNGRNLGSANTVDDIGAGFNTWRKEFVGAAHRAKAKGNSVLGHSIHDLRYRASWSPFSNHDPKDKTIGVETDDCAVISDFRIARTEDAETNQYAKDKSKVAYHNENNYHDSPGKVNKRNRFKKWERRIQDKIYQARVVRSHDVSLHQTYESSGGLGPSRRSESLKLGSLIMGTECANEDGMSPGSVQLDSMTPTKMIAEKAKARKLRMKSQGELTGLATFILREDAGHELSRNTNATTGRSRIPCVEGNGIGTQVKNVKLINVPIDKARFYDDCLISLKSDETEGEDEAKYEVAPATCSVKRPPETSSPRGREKSGRCAKIYPAAKKSLSSEHLRKSTDDFYLELKRMETIEREKALRIAKEAWGAAA